jgi:pseudaminic acid synthase
MRSPEIIAELSCNHLGSLERMLRLIEAAKQSGADAAKFQMWTQGTMVLDTSYVIRDGPWAGRSLFDIYDTGHVPWHWLPQMFAFARDIGIELFASVFDMRALAKLEEFFCPRYKIASFEIVDTPLISAVARTGKPIIISTGMATFDDIERAYWAVYHADPQTDVTLLKCTSSYPAPASDANLATIPRLRLFDYAAKSGLSDHTLGLVVPVAATALGATMIEKHLTISRSDGGPDAGFSSEPHEFKAMVDACREAAAALGKVRYGPTEAELPSLQFRRSLYWAKDIRQGEAITAEHLVTARPALGIPPGNMHKLIGRPAMMDETRGKPVQRLHLGYDPD